MDDRLHDGELTADAATVSALLAEQAPALAALPVRPLRAVGTVNRVFRLGPELAVRLPRLPAGGDDAVQEAAVVPRIASAVPVEVPVPVLLGRPSPGVFTAAWSVVRWVEGEQAEAGAVPVDDLVAVVAALQRLPTAGMPPGGRSPAARADAAVRDAVPRLTGFDRDRVAEAWSAALAAPAWDGEASVVHGDLLPPNLVVRDGRLTGVLDWGGAGAGDPANDLVPAWSCLRDEDRRRFRERLAPDDGTWARARGIALAQAVVAIPYYDGTNPPFAALCRATLQEVLSDPIR